MGVSIMCPAGYAVVSCPVAVLRCSVGRCFVDVPLPRQMVDWRRKRLDLSMSLCGVTSLLLFLAGDDGCRVLDELSLCG
jgi:hypothetical protein